MNSIARYRIVEEIGRGAMGRVLLAYDPLIERQIAIKLFEHASLAQADLDEALTRFKREAIAAGRLTHPNIVAVYEYGEESAHSYIVMEHVRGETLRSRLTRDGPLAPAVLLPLARQLFAAMIYAHEQGICHRDLKPANILLQPHPSDPGREQAKILDFGIARISAAADITDAGLALGTPGYMAPEQCNGMPTDERADVYAMGVVLFELLVGRKPFGGTVAQIFSRTINEDAPRIGSLRHDLPYALDAVFARALARDAEARYPDMRSFREALMTAMAHSYPAAPATAAPQHASRPAPATNVVPLRPPAAPRGAGTGTLQLQAIARSLASSAEAAAGSPSDRQTILFLDDEERILGALSALFRLQYNVLVATDGEQALDMVGRHRPHVIVSDQRMPGMPGVEFLRRAREIEPAAVRILLTGYADLAAIVGSVNEGEVFRFVCKPWSNREIRDTIDEAARISLASQAAETETSPPAVADAAHRASEALLVVQKGRELFDLLNDGFGRAYPVCHAGTVDEALATIEDQEVGVIICDMDSVEGSGVMFKLLKAAHPAIQGLALATNADSEAVIGLINEAQVHRIVTRPLRLAILDRNLRSALNRYQRIRARPALAERQQVAVRREVSQSPVGVHILQRFGALLRARVA